MNFGETLILNPSEIHNDNKAAQIIGEVNNENSNR
jgi:hypothetical protein